MHKQEDNMKIAITTFHRAYNYGAVLQCYALYHSLKELGHECYVLDYWPKYFYNQYYVHADFSITHPPIKTWINHLRIKKVLDERNKGFEKFLEEHLKLFPVDINDGQISVKNNKFDLYVTGSDQVWNDRCARFDRNYFLNFPSAKESNRTSYAASFGLKKIPENLREEYKNRLNGFEAYSVRESDGKNILEDLLGVVASVNCDPTLLLSQYDWNDVASNDLDLSDPYVLVYYVTKTNELQKQAYAYAKKNGYKLVVLPCNMGIDVLTGKNDKSLDAELRLSASPADFLSLFKNASYVFTNSFHGTVFSLLYHKQFSSQIRLDGNKQNSRALNLLHQVGLIPKNFDTDAFSTDVNTDWKLVDSNIATMRREGLNYLSAITKSKGVE